MKGGLKTGILLLMSATKNTYELTILNLSTLHTIQLETAESGTHLSLAGGSAGIPNFSVSTVEDINILRLGLAIPGCDTLMRGFIDAETYKKIPCNLYSLVYAWLGEVNKLSSHKKKRFKIAILFVNVVFPL